MIRSENNPVTINENQNTLSTENLVTSFINEPTLVNEPSVITSDSKLSFLVQFSVVLTVLLYQ